MLGRVVWTSVFADGPGGGNPCPVVLDAASLSDEEMQSAAAGFGAETVFVLPPRSGGDVRLRYFVPRHEMEMCVHATIAASVVLGAAGLLPASRARIESPLGLLGVTWAADSAIVDQFVPLFGAPLDDITLVAAALRIAAVAIAGPVRAVSTSRPKLMVPLRTEAALDALDPAHELLWQVCDQLDVTGFYPYAEPADGADLAARQFPRRAGYVEDPATGVAAAALAAHLSVGSRAPGWHTWWIAQGRAMGRPSLLRAEARVETSGAVVATRVGGTARERQPDFRHL
ncbi:MAG: PhzF family phenazine biosynthesis protein [Acidimicrobiales bacterium]